MTYIPIILLIFFSFFFLIVSLIVFLLRLLMYFGLLGNLFRLKPDSNFRYYQVRDIWERKNFWILLFFANIFFITVLIYLDARGTQYWAGTQPISILPLKVISHTITLRPKEPYEMGKFVVKEEVVLEGDGSQISEDIKFKFDYTEREILSSSVNFLFFNKAVHEVGVQKMSEWVDLKIRGDYRLLGQLNAITFLYLPDDRRIEGIICCSEVEVKLQDLPSGLFISAHSSEVKTVKHLDKESMSWTVDSQESGIRFSYYSPEFYSLTYVDEYLSWLIPLYTSYFSAPTLFNFLLPIIVLCVLAFTIYTIFWIVFPAITELSKEWLQKFLGKSTHNAKESIDEIIVPDVNIRDYRAESARKLIATKIMVRDIPQLEKWLKEEKTSSDPRKTVIETLEEQIDDCYKSQFRRNKI